ncbi:MAG: chemotaxis protein CheR, partial [Desulfuromonadales bacterium]|nr:chemotaxis protein CheR [Desulfuromonadales bacterium]
MAPISEDNLERLAALVRRHLGLDFPRQRWPDLVRGIEATCADLGDAGVATCAEKLLTPPLERSRLQALGRNLTVGETYFFREPQAFHLLQRQFLPELLASRRQEKSLRFWSAACASGEEAYSLAIAVRSQLPNLAQWKVTILATDINTAALRKAEQGEYGRWSFRAADPSFREEWFTPTETGMWRVRPEIRAMVTFAFHNL